MDTSKEDFGIYDIQVVVSYICDNFQLERNIIRGRRAILGVYPKNEDGEFAERAVHELTYEISGNNSFLKLSNSSKREYVNREILFCLPTNSTKTRRVFGLIKTDSS